MTEISQESSKKPKKVSKFKRHVIIFVAGALVALVVSTAIRFTLVQDQSIHYHANFALFINGQKDEFKSFTFYEEVAACDAHAADNPKVRTHMHDQKNHLIHVHAAGVTWGQFFENLGYTLGDNLIKTDDGVYITGDDGNKLSFTLNGEDVDHIANKVIKSEDTLLLNYGKDSSGTLKQRFEAIPRDAHTANMTKDPAACSGGNELTFWNRLQQAVGLPADQH